MSNFSLSSFAATAFVSFVLVGCATSATDNQSLDTDVKVIPALPSASQAPTSIRGYLNHVAAGTQRADILKALGEPKSSSLAGVRRTDTYEERKLSAMGLAQCGLLGAVTMGVGLILCQPTNKSTIRIRYVSDVLESYN